MALKITRRIRECRNVNFTLSKSFPFLSYVRSTNESQTANFHLIYKSDPKRGTAELSAKLSRICIICFKILSLWRNIISSWKTRIAASLQDFESNLWTECKTWFTAWTKYVSRDYEGPSITVDWFRNSADLRWRASPWLAFQTREKIASCIVRRNVAQGAILVRCFVTFITKEEPGTIFQNERMNTSSNYWFHRENIISRGNIRIIN